MAKKDKKIPVTGKDSSSSEIAKKFKQSPLLYIGSVAILVLVIVAFVGTDALAALGGGGGGDLTFGYYNKAPISLMPGNMFSMFYDRAKKTYQAQGYDIYSPWMDQLIMRQAFDESIVPIAVLQMVKRSNYTVPEKKVNKAVREIDFLLDSNGVFSIALYERISESDQLQLWNQKKDELTEQMFFGDFNSLLITKAEADFIAAMGSSTRNFEVVSFDVENFPESEYLSYAQENSRLFNSIHVSKITIRSSERDARRVLSSIRDGSISFEEAARNQSHDNYAERGGDMGVRYFYEIEQEIPNAEDREKIFSLRRGEISDVISTVSGWSFFRIENDVVNANFDDETIMHRVRWYIENYARGRMENWAFELANHFIQGAKETGFADAAYSRNLERHSVGPFSLNYGNVEIFSALSIPGVSQQDISEMSRNEDFWKTAFFTQIGTPCEPFVQGNFVYVFLPVEQITEDEESISFISSAYNDYWLKLITERTLQLYFIKHKNMNDRFDTAYKRITGQ